MERRSINLWQKFNLWNVYYAPLLTNTTSKIEYGTPIAIPGAVSLSLDPTGENTPFYADGVEYYTISNNMGYSGDLEIALIPESFRVDILKESLVSRYDSVSSELQKVSDEIHQRRVRLKLTEHFLDELKKKKETITEFSQDLLNSTVESITVYSKERIVFKFKNGKEIEIV